MAVTAALVKELREKTGAGMMDCKKALAETDGNLEAAVDWLRKKGLAAAAKKAGRTAAEGLVAVAASGNKGAVVELNAETDFVARNDGFQALVKTIAGLAVDVPAIVELKKVAYPGSERDVEGEITHAIATIGENMNLRRTAGLAVEKGVVASYIHNAVADGMGKIGVLVALESEGDEATLLGLGKQIAMHVAATQPASTTIEDLDPALIEREKKVLSDQARESGKPEEIIEKMIVGRMRKYYEEVVLNEQTFVMDTDKKVKDVVAAAGKDLGAAVKLAGFVAYRLGEGIEVEEKDFAAEVAEQLGK